MISDTEAPPPDRAGFLRWYHEQTTWSEDHAYNNVEVTTPKLRNWYVEIIRDYPAMDGPAAIDDPDNPKLTDYRIGKVVIYASFAWSQAESARADTFRLADKHNEGFFDVSAKDGGVWIPTSNGYVCVHGNRSGRPATLKSAFKGFFVATFEAVRFERPQVRFHSRRSDCD